MKKSNLFFLVILGFASHTFAAEPHNPISFDHVFLNLGYDWVEVENADFNGSLSGEAGVRWKVEDSFLLEASLSGINDSDTDKVEDNRGAYSLALDSWDVLFGGLYQHAIKDQFEIYGRAGFLAYRMQLDLEESFYDLKAAGSDSVSDNGYGFYAGVGCLVQLDANWRIASDLVFKRRLDFLDDSSRPFDVDTFGINVGARYYFK